jgi:hypothetical protein
MIQEEFRNLAKSDFGKVLMNFLDEEIKEMTDIAKIKDYDELLGKQEAVKILRKLFSFLRKAREKNPTIQKTDYN